MTGTAMNRQESGEERNFLSDFSLILGLVLMVAAGLLIIGAAEGHLVLLPIGVVSWMAGLLIYLWGLPRGMRG